MKYAIYCKISGEYLHSNKEVGWDYNVNEVLFKPRLFSHKFRAQNWLEKNNECGDLIVVKVKQVIGWEIVDI